ncbi:MAG: Indole-3-glycerol-phosphate synthase [Myxococcales bacterium]|nr:Indole-3-glycerol-phosphate synthase [Myxococcales bacterium]
MILDQIVAEKRREQKRRFPVAMDELWARIEGLAPARPFAASLRQPNVPQKPGALRVIAEFKRRSPSAGDIRLDADVATVGRAYEKAGAAAMSILTDAKFFGGSMDDLKRVRGAARLPLLRKDFLLDERDLIDARLAGADAVLLIVRILDARTLSALLRNARECGLAALVEAHSDAEIEAALAAGAEIIGVNHRDLDTLAVDLTLSARARSLAPEAILVAESGIQTRAHIALMREHQVDAILVGESLMRASDPAAALQALIA